ncbi:hypothetical protein FB451DRAFT_1185941 [Mycena latifolia]|nr:hypothetical protein FB451DRAFT_1185941 [Mycena latifolia]
MQRIVEALASKKAWTVDLVAYWDRILFPDADKGHSKDAASARDPRLEAGEDDDDLFGSALAVVSPARPAAISHRTHLHRLLAPITGSHAGSESAAIRPHPRPALPHRLAAAMGATRPRCPADQVIARQLRQAVVTGITRKLLIAVVVKARITV